MSEMCVGPTRGLAERGRPFFRHPLLDGGVGGTPGTPRSQTPCTQPGGEVIALRTRAACQIAVSPDLIVGIIEETPCSPSKKSFECIQSADSIDLKGERCPSAGDCRNIRIAAVFGLLKLDNCPGNIRSFLIEHGGIVVLTIGY